ncbi:MAG: multiubiquitin domain-containing protein [Erysipelotrichaceae bacterium]|nr:multiubiquitin domain-containing protein [Erysipelotrichaceae bacterium]
MKNNFNVDNQNFGLENGQLFSKDNHREHDHNHPVHPEHPEHPNHPEHPGNPGHSKHVTIIVNGRDISLDREIRKLSYEDVVKLAYGCYDDSSMIIYTVMYVQGPIQNRKGTLVKGGEVFIKEGMIFNVGCSNKS